MAREREVMLDDRGGVMLNDHEPLTLGAMAKIIAATRKIPKSDRTTDNIEFHMMWIRLERAMPQMTLPRPQKGPLAERIKQIRTALQGLTESKTINSLHPLKRYRLIGNEIQSLYQVIFQ